MKKRIAKKILKNKDKLNYKPQQIKKAEEKFSTPKTEKKKETDKS